MSKGIKNNEVPLLDIYFRRFFFGIRRLNKPHFEGFILTYLVKDMVKKCVPMFYTLIVSYSFLLII